MNASYTISREPVVRGEIYYVMPKTTEENAGTLNSGGRPAIIISNDMINQVSGYVSIIYMSRAKSHTKTLPTDVTITSSSEESIALCHEIHTVPKHRIGRFINQATENEMKNIEKAIAMAYSSPVDKQTIRENVEMYNSWQKYLEEKMIPAAGEKEPDTVSMDAEKSMADAGVLPQNLQPITIPNITNTPEYIKLETERDIYKNLYTDLLRERLG